MKNTNVTRVKKTDTLVPASMAEANNLLSRLGGTQDLINEIEKSLQAEIAELKANALKKLQPLEIQRDNQVNALFAFANSHKVRLTLKNRTIELSAGVFGWRLTTPRVEMRKDDEEMIKLFKRTGNAQFIRIKEEIDRQTLLAEKPVIPGVSYVQNDEFFVVPKQIGKKPKTLTKAIDR